MATIGIAVAAIGIAVAGARRPVATVATTMLGLGSAVIPLAAMTGAAAAFGMSAAPPVPAAAGLGLTTAMALTAPLASSVTVTLGENRRSQRRYRGTEGEIHRTHGMISLIMRTNGARKAKVPIRRDQRPAA
jgi:hypothetical protein